jgi:hypothetical protein
MNLVLKFTLILGISFQLSCQNKSSDKMIFVANLPNLLDESSGIESVVGSDGFWMINDAGNSNDLFEISKNGQIINIVEVENAKNKDWEDLASDGHEKIFIGDFGNNENDRKNLSIYSISINSISKNKVVADKIKFSFEDQTKFPPKKKNRNFDVEAFIYMNNYFYLFTKNRSSHFNGLTKLYKVPNVKGKHVAKLVGEFITCSDTKTCLITGATISRDNKKLVLLTHDKLFEFSNFEGDDFFNASVKEIRLDHNSQKEAICFKGNDLFVTDEFSNEVGGNLYKVKN